MIQDISNGSTSEMEINWMILSAKGIGIIRTIGERWQEEISNMILKLRWINQIAKNVVLWKLMEFIIVVHAASVFLLWIITVHGQTIVLGISQSNHFWCFSSMYPLYAILCLASAIKFLSREKWCTLVLPSLFHKRMYDLNLYHISCLPSQGKNFIFKTNVILRKSKKWKKNWDQSKLSIIRSSK